MSAEDTPAADLRWVNVCVSALVLMNGTHDEQPTPTTQLWTRSHRKYSQLQHDLKLPSLSHQVPQPNLTSSSLSHKPSFQDIKGGSDYACKWCQQQRGIKHAHPGAVKCCCHWGRCTSADLIWQQIKGNGVFEAVKAQ